MIKIKIYAVFLFCLISSSINAQVEASKTDIDINEQLKSVKLIDWSRFHASYSATNNQQLAGKILLNCNKYALTNWWKLRGFEGAPASDYLNLKGITEHFIRPIAAEAEALAVSLKTGLYNEAATGVPVNEAESKTVQMIRSLAHAHRANSEGGWGKHWQSALWAGYATSAAWMMWDKLDLQTKREVLAMVNFECNWIMTNKGLPTIKVYRDRNGKIASPGDTGSEENAWDGLILGVASAMMPKLYETGKWTNKLVSLSLNAMARPSDVKSDKKYNGKPLTEWLVGSNINEDGTAVNHHFIHPDYMVSAFELNSAKYFWLANNKIPKAFTLNADLVFHALADLNFKVGDKLEGGTVQEPGGTIFIKDSGEVFYPLGTDWGKGRRMHFAMFNSIITVFSLDKQVKQRAEQWQLLQGRVALNMQNRFNDGHTYIDKSEDNYVSREEWVANKAATSYIIETLKIVNKPKFTNRSF